MGQARTDYRKMRAEVSLRYGVELDETSLAILAVLSAEQQARFDGQNQKLDKAIHGITQSKQTLQADSQRPGRQAFWLGMGQWGMALIFAVSVASVVYMVQANENSSRAATEAKLEWYRTFYQLTTAGSAKQLKVFLKQNPAPENP